MTDNVSAITHLPRSQKGSVVILLVMAAAVVALLFIVANVTIFSREFSNTLGARKQAYVENASARLDAWYRRNAAQLDSLPAIPTYTEDQLFTLAGLTRDFDAHIAMSGVVGVPGSNLFYRNIVVWLPAFGVDDTSYLGVSGEFHPAFNETLYRVVSGQTIEGENIGRTQTTMREIARLLEVRSKSKFEADPLHDVRTNYFRALYCSTPGSEEIPCTSKVTGPGAGGWALLSEPLLNLYGLAGINLNMATDAWGQAIQFNNYEQSAYSASNTLQPCGDTTAVGSDDTETGEPPYVATLRTTTPWGTILCMRAIQPLN